MSEKYYQKVDGVYKDFYNLCESKVYDKAPWCDKFTGDTDRQKSSSQAPSVTLSNFYVGDSAITAVKRGHFPAYIDADSVFHTITSAGTWDVTRTDTTLTIGSSVYYASDFRCNQIPSRILVLVCGGGGGGGGNGYWSPGKDKNGYARICSAAGGGGGMAVGIVTLSNSTTYKIQVGSGGAVGANGSSSANSAGSTGTGGTASMLYTPRSGGAPTIYVGGTGGGGGTGGDGTSGKAESIKAGTGGNGGTGECGVTYGTTKSGGGGNQLGNHGRTAISAMSKRFYTDLTTPTIVFTSDLSLDGDGLNKSDYEGNTSYFSGGCSFDYGASPYLTVNGVLQYFYEAGIGGGGGGGSQQSAGGTGCAIFMY